MTAEELDRADKVESITAEFDTLTDMLCCFVAEICGHDRTAVGLRILCEHIKEEIKTLK